MIFEVYDTDNPVGEVWPLNIEVRNMIADPSKKCIHRKKHDEERHRPKTENLLY